MPDDRAGEWAADLLATGVTDLRRGVTSLYALILEQLQQEPLSGAIFAFCGARREARPVSAKPQCCRSPQYARARGEGDACVSGSSSQWMARTAVLDAVLTYGIAAGR